MDRFSDLEAFVAVVDTGSFSAAGERLGIAKSVVSRRVSRLEQRLGSRLLVRTTRRLSQTDAGRHFHARAVRLLADLDDAEQSVADETAELRGSIRLAAPLSFGIRYLAADVAEFLRQYPAIDLTMDLNDRHVNLVEEGFDMAVRIGDLPDSTLVARQLGIVRSVTCASKAYLQRHGEPAHPDDLGEHEGLQYSNITTRQQWCFLDAAGSRLYAQPRIRLRANNGEALATAAIAGLGISSGPTFILGVYIRRGELTCLLTDYPKPQTAIHGIYPPGRLTPARVRVFSDFLAARYGDAPPWDEGLPCCSR